MKNRFIKRILLFLILIPLNIYAIVDQSNQVYVTDSAKLLTAESEAYIIKYSDFLYQEKKIDYYVVTIRYLEEKDIEEYAQEIFQKYHMNKNGILILVSKDDRKIRIEIGKKLRPIFDEEEIDQYINTYFMPYLERDEWNDGIINGYSAIYKDICEANKIDASSMETVDHLDFITKYKTILIFLIIWLIMFIGKQYKKYQEKIKNNTLNKKEIIKLLLLIVLNIIAVSVSYALQPVYILFVIAFEVVILYTNTNSLQLSACDYKETNNPKKKRK